MVVGLEDAVEDAAALRRETKGALAQEALGGGAAAAAGAARLRLVSTRTTSLAEAPWPSLIRITRASCPASRC